MVVTVHEDHVFTMEISPSEFCDVLVSITDSQIFVPFDQIS